MEIYHTYRFNLEGIIISIDIETPDKRVADAMIKQMLPEHSPTAANSTSVPKIRKDAKD